MSKVFFIMVDGLRPDALYKGYSPHIDQLFQSGASTLNAQSVFPSVTLPCHMSIFHSVPPTRHGVTSNVWTPMARPLPGMIELMTGLHTAFFYSWEPLRNLNTPETLSFSYYRCRANNTLEDSQHVARTAKAYIHDEQPDFAFVYLGATDIAGHAFGWMEDGYLQTIASEDELVGELLDSLSDDYTVILHSDHGGHDRSHGLTIPEDMTIPWGIAGSGIKSNYSIERPMSLLDTAPTIATVLGISPHPEWEGSCPMDIFV